MPNTCGGVRYFFAPVPAPPTIEGKALLHQNSDGVYHSPCEQILMRASQLTCSWALQNYFGPEFTVTEMETMGYPPRARASFAHTIEHALERIFTHRVARDCRARSRKDAQLVLIPVPLGLPLLLLHNRAHAEFRAAVRPLKQWYPAVLQAVLNSPAWRVCGGCDHVLVYAREFEEISDFWQNVHRDEAPGSTVSRYREARTIFRDFLTDWRLQNVSVLAVGGPDPSRANTIGMPYPTFFHPSASDHSLPRWQSFVEHRPRPNLLLLAAGMRASRPIRAVLAQACVNSSRCFYARCADPETCRTEQVAAMYLNASFCLQPPGDFITRRGFFDAIACGCIPIVFHPWTSGAYLWWWERLLGGKLHYAALMAHDFDDAMTQALALTRKEVATRRQALIRLLPLLSYAGEGGGDAIETVSVALANRLKHPPV